MSRLQTSSKSYNRLFACEKKKQECYLMKIFLRGFPFLLIENEEEQIQIIANRPKQIKPNKISLEIRELYLID